MPIQMCPIEIPQGYEFVRYAKLTARCGETFIDSLGAIDIWNAPCDSACPYIILRRIPPVPKYIPFTAETFRPHRDRWVRWKDTKVEWQVCWFDSYKQFGPSGTTFYFERVMDTLEFINADGTTEPFGQKVEG